MGLFKHPELKDEFVYYEGKKIKTISLNQDNVVQYGFGESVLFLRRTRTQGEKLIVDYFHRCDSQGKPLPDAHPHKDYLLYSQEAYNVLVKRFLEKMKKGGLSESDLEEVLKASNGFNEEAILVHVSRKDSMITPKPVAKVRLIEKKK
ncbi:MAG: hypothetical protein AABX54_04065 [Nanoarchaeota archaeon]